VTLQQIVTKCIKVSCMILLHMMMMSVSYVLVKDLLLYSFSYNVSVVHNNRVWNRVDSEMVEEREYAGWNVDSR
jgi:hypothetical protein